MTAQFIDPAATEDGKTELPPSTRLRKAVFGGSLMFDSGNGQAQSAKVNPMQKQFCLNRGASKK
jgi:hypothetical protein